MTRTWAIAALALAGCLEGARAEQPTADLSAHSRACTAKGEVLIARSQMAGKPCPAIEAELKQFVSADEDCRAYYGDASVSAELCAEEIAPRPKSPQSAPSPDGGAE